MFSSQVKAIATTHGTFDIRNASQKNCSGEWTSCPQTFFNTSFDAGKASKLPDSFLQENVDLEGCQRQEKLRIFGIFETSSLNYFQSRVSLENLFFPLEPSENSLFKGFFVHSPY